MTSNPATAPRLGPPGPPAGRRAGFTLIELMTVCAVIGILAVVAIPNFLRATSRAKRGSCLSNQRNVVTQTIVYVADQGITDAVIPVSTLVDAGYCPQALAECPSSDVEDFDDYEITVEGGNVTAIACNVEADQHLWDP